METNLTVFDTHAFVKRLITVGFTEEQAEVFADEQGKLIEQRLATKQDILALNRDMKDGENNLKRDMKELEASLKRDMKGLEASLKRDMEELDANLHRDMKELETKLHRDLKELDANLHRDMKELEIRLTHELTLRLGGLMMAGIVVVVTLVKVL